MNIPVGNNGGIELNISFASIIKYAGAGLIGILGWLAMDKLTSIETTFAQVSADLKITNQQLIALDKLTNTNALVNDLQGKVLSDYESRLRNLEERRRFSPQVEP